MMLVRNAQLWKCNPGLHQWWEGNWCWTLIFHFPFCNCLQEAWLRGLLSYRIKLRPDRKNLTVSLPSLTQFPDLYSPWKQAFNILDQKLQRLHHLQIHKKKKKWFVGFSRFKKFLFFYNFLKWTGPTSDVTDVSKDRRLWDNSGTMTRSRTVTLQDNTILFIKDQKWNNQNPKSNSENPKINQTTLFSARGNGKIWSFNLKRIKSPDWAELRNESSNQSPSICFHHVNKQQLCKQQVIAGHLPKSCLITPSPLRLPPPTTTITKRWRKRQEKQLELQQLRWTWWSWEGGDGGRGARTTDGWRASRRQLTKQWQRGGRPEWSCFWSARSEVALSGKHQAEAVTLTDHGCHLLQRRPTVLIVMTKGGEEKDHNQHLIAALIHIHIIKTTLNKHAAQHNQSTNMRKMSNLIF